MKVDMYTFGKVESLSAIFSVVEAATADPVF